MINTLSQLVRKPSKVNDHYLELTGWKEKQSQVLKYIEGDRELLKLLEDFKLAHDQLLFFRSTNDFNIYFLNQEKGGEQYLYARCMFTIDGKPKEFRKYIGLASKVDQSKVNMDHLKQLFLRMLKNFLEN